MLAFSLVLPLHQDERGHMSVRALTERNGHLALREKSPYAPLASAAARQNTAHLKAKRSFAFLTALGGQF